MFLRFFISVLCLFGIVISYGQVVINEVLSSNYSGIKDEDQALSDWIEIYNTSDATLNLEGYKIKDKLSDSIPGWEFPRIEITPKSHLLVFASGKDRKSLPLLYKTIITAGDKWQYLVPSGKSTMDWRIEGFDASNWKTGASGFGFGDNDDQTVLTITNSLYIRKEFQVANVETIQKLILHVDFDDAFAAFINGKLVAAENVSFTNRDYENALVSGSHEAQIYQGLPPTAYVIEVPSEYLRNGKNVLAIQGYNSGASSSDFSLIPFLTLGSTSFTTSETPEFISFETANLHTNFKIAKEGESLYLFNNQNILVDSVAIPPLPTNISYGRYEDGQGKWFYFPTPTPGTINLNPIGEIRNDSIYFSTPPGFYQQPFSLTIATSTSNGEIRYTTDGSLPTIESKLYASAINISKTQVIKAASFFNGVVSSNTFASTYFIAKTHTLPVVSISTDPKNLFDYNEGILVEGPNASPQDPKYGANYWMDWEKPVNLEYFDKDGHLQLNQGAGLKITGAWSRMKAQKSMALFARKEYGKGTFDYQLFHDKETKKYESFMLRNSGNDWEYTMLRDGFSSEIAKNLNVDRLAYQPSVVYLNGEYWGILNMREKPNEAYFENNYGVDKDKLNILEQQGGVVNGDNTDYIDLINFLENNTLLSDADYKKVLNQIDVDCFIDYQLFQIYIYNDDWPGNNIKYWKSQTPNAKWRWILYDTDFGYSLYNAKERANGLRFATATSGPSWPNPPWSTLLLRRLLTNESFKFKFINRLADCMNSSLRAVKMNDLLDSLTTNIDSEIGNHQELWGRSYDLWQSYIHVVEIFNLNRPSYMRDHIKSFFNLDQICKVSLKANNYNYGTIQVNTLIPDEYPFNGYYYSNVALPFKALPKPGYRFVRWDLGSTATTPEIKLTLTGDITLKAIFEPVETVEEKIVINEINYNSDSSYNSGDWVELYNAGSQTIDLSGWILSDATLANGFTFPAGYMLYPNSYLVVVANKDKFRQIHNGVSNFVGNASFGLNSSGDVLLLYDKDGNIVDYIKYETASPWPTSPLETAATLMLANANDDNSLAQSWIDGPLGGTPGRSNDLKTSNNLVAEQSHQSICFPNVFNDFTTLKMYSRGEGNYSVSLADIQGRILKTSSGRFEEAGNYYLDLFADGNFYQKGIYFVKIKTEKTSETIRVVKQ
jgi:hypothetical protein